MAKVEDIKARIELELQSATTEEAVTKLGMAVTDLKKRISDLKKEYKKNGDASGDLEREWTAGERAVADYTKSINKNQAEMRKYSTDVTHAKGSLNALREELKNTRAKFDAMGESERKSNNEGKKLAKQIKDLDKQIRKLEESTGRSQRNVGNYGSVWKNIGNIFNRIGLGVLGAAQAMVQFRTWVLNGIDTAINFNRELSKLAAIMGTTTKGIKELTAQAKQLGSETRYTASQVASLQVELAKLGYQKSQIINMTESVLEFAQATGSNLAEAAALAGASLRIFGADSTQATHYVDLMAAATSKSALSFDYIKTALPIVGSVADSLGFSLGETLSVLGQLANAGIDASMAATAARNIFLELANANGELARQIGKPVKTLPELVAALRDLKDRGINLGDAFELVGKRATNAFENLTKGTDGVEDLASELEKADGAAKQMAKTMEDNLGGAITSLQSKWQDLMLSLQGEQGFFRNVIEVISKFVAGIAELARTKEESIQIGVDNQLQEYLFSPRFKALLDSDVKRYNDYVNDYQKLGNTLYESQKLAKERVLQEIDDQNESLDKDVQDAKALLDEYEETTTHRSMLDKTDLQLMKYSYEWNLKRQKAIKEGNEEAKKLADDSITELNKYLGLRKKYEFESARRLSQSTRREKFDNGISLTPERTGLDIISQSDLEKLYKLLEDSEKRFIDELDKSTSEGLNKVISHINTKYDNEKITIRTKLHEIGEIIKQDLDDITLIEEEEQTKIIEGIKNADAQNAVYQYLEAYKKAEENKSKEILDVRQKFQTDSMKLLQEYYELQSKLNSDDINEQHDWQVKAAKEKYDIDMQSLQDQKRIKEQEVKDWQEVLTYEDLEQNKEYQQALAELENYRLQEATINEEYNRKIEELNESLYSKQTDQIKQQYETRIAQTYDEVEQLRITEAEKYELAARTLRMIGETEEAYRLRKAQAERDAQDATIARIKKELDVRREAAVAVVGGFQSIADAMSEMDEKNKASARLAKVLGLAEIYINQGVALAEAVATQSKGDPYTMFARIATAVTTIVASTLQAVSSLNKAKFAKGVVNLQGAGTTTSDSIPARLSRGESVMTARATDKFGALLQIMNQVASQPSVTLPTQYSLNNVAQNTANTAGFSDNVIEAVENIHPVVAVEEINRVGTRYNNIKVLENI